MKRIPLLIMILIAMTALLYSASLTDSYMYLVPTTSSAIDLMSTWYPTRDEYLDNPTGLNWAQEDTRGHSGYDWGGYYYDHTNPSSDVFYNMNIILSGGYANNSNDTERALLEGGKVVLSVSTNTNSLELTSLSNNAYSRPFVCYAFFSTGSGSAYSNHQRISLIKMDSVNTRFTLDNLSGFKSSGTATGTGSSANNTAIFFDLILALPGDFSSGSTVLTYDGATYRLAERDDYSVMLTINMEFFDSSDNSIGTKSITIPLSGYVSLDNTFIPTKVSMAVNLNPIFNIIDIEQYAGQRLELGEINLMINYGAGGSSTGTAVFLSSNKSPFVSGEKFKFKRKKDVLEGNIIGDSNSLGFDLVLLDNDVQSEPKIFDGDEHIGQYTGIMVDGTGTEITDSRHGYMKTHNSTGGYAIHAGGSSYVWDYLNADLSMILETPVTGMLQEGLYEETVYIHVVSGLNTSTGTT